jgi:hypothetical protein
MVRLKEVLEKLRLNQYAIWGLLGLGVLLMLAPTLWSSGRQGGMAALKSDAGTATAGAVNSEGAILAEQTAKILGAIKGAGEVRVFLTLEKSSGQEETPAFGGSSSRQLLGPQVRGVLIIASGAADPQVRWQLYQAVAALFDVPGEMIYVVEGGEKQ